jgi:hypothetical protein
MNLLIAIPTKTADYYRTRAAACEATWLKDSPVDYKFFSDADLGLNENDIQVRPKRTKLMCRYALDHGYEYIYRVDADAYVWVNRLLASGFEKHDYVGFCLDYPKHLETDHGLRTAHGGAGFILSRTAMQIVADAEPFKQSDGIYWGDIWTGEVLWKHAIYCHRDTRFLDCGDGNFTADRLPANHPYISVHPIEPHNLYGFTPMPSETVAPEKQLFEVPVDFSYGEKRPDICSCTYCQPKPRLCVDFDGTIYDGTGIFDGCIEALSELRKSYTIAIFSARQTEAEREQMRELLRSFDVPHDEVLDAKPEAVAYLDDKGIRFDGDWRTISIS